MHSVGCASMYNSLLVFVFLQTREGGRSPPLLSLSLPHLPPLPFWDYASLLPFLLYWKCNGRLFFLFFLFLFSVGK